MKTTVITLACVLALTSGASAQAVDLTGKWDVSIAGTQQGNVSAPLELKKDGDKFVGVFSTPQGNADVSATVKDNVVTFVLPPFQTQNGPIEVTMSGTVDGDTMKGTMDAGGRATFDWVAKRAPAAQPPAKPSEPDPEPKLDLSGTWALEVSTANGVGRPTLVLKQTSEKLSGQYSSTYGEFPVTGTITGAEFTFSIQMGVEGNTVAIIYTGKAEKETMKGTVTLGEMGEGTFVGKKK
jgi:hypothetical protein